MLLEVAEVEVQEIRGAAEVQVAVKVAAPVTLRQAETPDRTVVQPLVVLVEVPAPLEPAEP